MLFATYALILAGLLQPAVLAIRSHNRIGHGAHRHTRVHSRRSTHRRDTSAPSSDPDVRYDSHWTGALWDVEPGTFTSITGTFNVPEVWGSPGAVVSAWVGIDGDGDGCGQGLLQSGIDCVVGSGSVWCGAWYEWYPDGSHAFAAPFRVSAADTIKVTINTDSVTSGIVVIENLTSGQMGSQNLTSTYEICQQSAEWIVEDYAFGTTYAPFANFSTITFTDAEAKGGDQTYTPLGSTIIDMQQNGHILTSVTTDDSTITIRHL